MRITAQKIKIPSNIFGTKKAAAPTTTPMITVNKIDLVILYKVFNKCLIVLKTYVLLFYFINTDLLSKKMSIDFDGHFKNWCYDFEGLQKRLFH
jgi:hypothetical protein